MGTGTDNTNSHLEQTRFRGAFVCMVLRISVLGSLRKTAAKTSFFFFLLRSKEFCVKQTPLCSGTSSFACSFLLFRLLESLTHGHESKSLRGPRIYC